MRTIPLKLWRKLNWTVANVVSVPSYFAWRLSESPWVEQTIFQPRYQRAREAYRSFQRPLGERETEIVDAIEARGIYITSLDKLPILGADELLRAALHLAKDLEVKSTLAAFSDQHEVHVTLQEFKAHPEIFRWGLQEQLLQIVGQYLGLSAAYDGASCLLSVADSREIGVRSWHRDLEDRRMLKICVYLNDVDEEGGPLECLGPDLNQQLCKSEQYQHKPISDREMQALSTQPNQKITCTGLAGTVIFLDTARFFHRGKPPTARNRAAVFFHYFSHRPSRPYFCHRTPFSKGNIAPLLSDLSKEQRASVQWAKTLPAVARLIPRKRI